MRSATCPMHAEWGLNLANAGANVVLLSQSDITGTCFVSPVHDESCIILQEKIITKKKTPKIKGCKWSTTKHTSVTFFKIEVPLMKFVFHY